MDELLRFGYPGLAARPPEAAGDGLPLRLHYGFTPNPVPCTVDTRNPSVVTLMIAATNTTDEELRCSELKFIVPVKGDGALTTKPERMKPHPDAGTKWTIVSDETGTLTATPIGARPVIRPKSSIAFLVEDVEVAPSVGEAVIEVHESIDETRIGFRVVTKVAPGLAITRLTATPISVEPDGRSTIVWTTTGAVSCTFDGATVGKNGEKDVYPVQTTHYTLTAEAAAGTIQQQITVTVPELRIIRFVPNPQEVGMGGKSNLEWRVINAERCVIEPGRTSVTPTRGEHEVTVEKTTEFTLHAYGYENRQTRSEPTKLYVMPVAIEKFGVSPTTVKPGPPNKVVLDWATKFARSCTIDQGVGTVPVTGTREVTPRIATTYTLHADGLDPREKQVRVEVAPALLGVGVTPSATLDQKTAKVHLGWGARSGDLLLKLPDRTERVPAWVKDYQVLVPRTGVFPIKLLLADPPQYPLVDLELEGFGIPMNIYFYPRLSIGSEQENGLTTPGATALIDLTAPTTKALRAVVTNGKGATKSLVSNWGLQQPFPVDQDAPFGSPNALWSGDIAGEILHFRWKIRWRVYCPSTP